MSGEPSQGHLRAVLGQRYVRHLAWVAALVVASAIFAYGGGNRGQADTWVEVGTLTDLRAEGVIYLRQHGVFVLHEAAYPLALHEDVEPVEGDRVVWCPTAQVFEETAHGSKFDRTGAYMDGPASRGLDEAPVRVEGDRVLVDPGERIQGPARGARPPQEPAGPFCIGADGAFVEDPPGFARPAA